MQSITDAIAAWAAGIRLDLSDVARERARNALVDTIGCIVAGAGDEGAAAVRRAALGYGDGPASVLGARRGAAAPWAALANGMAAHALDFDDILAPGSNHASAVLVPALLALAEAREASGAALVDAFVVGVEVQTLLGRGMGRRHYDLGWHTTSTIGCIGAAAACARLLGLGAGGMRDAISLSVSMASGPKVQFGSPAKPLHAGIAAQHAVVAADLAAHGLSGRPDAIEGERGFVELFAGAQDGAWDTLLAEIGRPLAIERFGLLAKPYPCCGSTHRILDGVLALRAEHRLDPGQVAAVHALVGYGNKRNLCYPEPRHEMEARFSMNYCVAVALASGRVSLADFTEQAVQRPEIRKLLPLVTMEARAPDAEGSDPASRLPHVVTVRLRGGRTLERSVLWPKGSAEHPFTAADIEGKFRDCCEGFLAPDDLHAAWDVLHRIESTRSVRELTRHLRFEASSDRGERFVNRSRAA